MPPACGKAAPKTPARCCRQSRSADSSEANLTPQPFQRHRIDVDLRGQGGRCGRTDPKTGQHAYSGIPVEGYPRRRPMFSSASTWHNKRIDHSNVRPGTEHTMAQADTEPKSVDQDALVADIDRTRAELAATIDAISDRVSPKKNARRVLDQVRQRAAQVDPRLAGGAAAALAVGAVVLVVWRRRKR